MLYRIILYLSALLVELIIMFILSNITKSNKSPPHTDIVHFLSANYFTTIVKPRIKIIKSIKDLMCITPACILLITIPSFVALKILDIGVMFHCFIRPIFFCSTILPRCSDRKELKSIFDALNGANCDYIFSGHAFIVILSCHYLEKFFYFYGILYIYSFITCLIIIICREHYTIDILVAILAVSSATYFIDY